MSGNHLFIVKIRPRRMARLRDGRHRRLAMERLEYRWLLSAAAGATPWPAAAAAAVSATTWPTSAPTATTTLPPAAAAAASVTSLPAAAPAAATATSLPAAASNADCDGEGGWADVGPSGSGNSGSGSEYQTNPASSSWSSSGADQLPAKKPGLLVLSPDELRADAAGEGGLADLTRISNQPPMALLAATPPSSGAAGNAGGDAVLRPLTGAIVPTETAESALSGVKLDGLRGTSQAFDVAISPVRTHADAATVEDPSTELGFHPATVWPMPLLPRIRPESGGLPATSVLPDSAPLPGDGKTTFVPPQAPAADSDGANMPSANRRQRADSPQLGRVSASAREAKTRAGMAHDKVFAHIADFLHDLSTAARLNDRRFDAAIVAVALAALPFGRFRKRDDSVV